MLKPSVKAFPPTNGTLGASAMFIPKKELIDTLVDKIVIDKDRNITICLKYDIVPEVTFKYENRNLARNPYGRKGKNG